MVPCHTALPVGLLQAPCTRLHRTTHLTATTTRLCTTFILANIRRTTLNTTHSTTLPRSLPLTAYLLRCPTTRCLPRRTTITRNLPPSTTISLPSCLRSTTLLVHLSSITRRVLLAMVTPQLTPLWPTTQGSLLLLLFRALDPWEMLLQVLPQSLLNYLLPLFLQLAVVPLFPVSAL
jgi:hypothetical protein